MRVNTLRFGELEIPEEATVVFPEGILGFPQFHRVSLLPHRPGSALRWLQSLDDPALAFLGTEPHLFFPDYQFEIPDPDAEALGLTAVEEAAVLTLITISHQGRAAAGTASAAARWARRRSPGKVQRLWRPSLQGSAQVTTNLAAPIIINTRSRQARQIILSDDRYLTRHLIGILGRSESGAELMVGSTALTMGVGD
jgi:flagellar assembly factor FliW